MTEIILQDPPPAKQPFCNRAPSPIRVWLDTLRRDHPGEWAIYPEKVNSGVAHQIRTGKSYAKPGEFDSTTRGTGNRVDLYARYIGPPEANP